MYWVYVWGIPLAVLVFTLSTWHNANKILGKWRGTKNSEVSQVETTSIKGIEPGINFGGVNIYVSPNRDKVIAWTNIKLLDKTGKEHTIELSPDHFRVEETYNRKTKGADVKNITRTYSNGSVKAILLLDNSGSMDQKSGVLRSARTKSEFTKTQLAKKAASDFISHKKSEGTEFAFLPVAGEAVTKNSFLKKRNGQIWWTQSQALELNEQINNLEPSGNTPLWNAIDVALDQLRNMPDEAYKVIVCLTDGLNTSEKIPFYLLVEKAEQSHIPIYTLGYGAKEQINEEGLIQLSDKSGAGKEGIGSFMRIPPKDWSARLQDIRANISNLYQISWVPKFPVSNATVTVKISVEANIHNQPYTKNLYLSYVFPQE